jgi:hypothetical protein
MDWKLILKEVFYSLILPDCMSSLFSEIVCVNGSYHNFRFVGFSSFDLHNNCADSLESDVCSLENCREFMV